ncbi:hypothetical protein LB543_32430 [Mesorhizobium sp. ESP7-2]|uniref:hypothetical protein n=1 Tax=Mesorhizobium sp. ESP7-2 TaxID=2876622 RepID=UPI001CCAEB30|nr:hypothetical protein [Mesorhizobium sp. ESP7-2]MBZ9711405.1 hypothetical protein [Mesorhizobium sp. ESP7-2]
MKKRLAILNEPGGCSQLFPEIQKRITSPGKFDIFPVRIIKTRHFQTKSARLRSGLQTSHRRRPSHCHLPRPRQSRQQPMQTSIFSAAFFARVARISGKSSGADRFHAPYFVYDFLDLAKNRTHSSRKALGGMFYSSEALRATG